MKNSGRAGKDVHVTRQWPGRSRTNVLTLKIAVRLACLRQSFRKALQTAATLGAEAVEIDARTEIRPAEMTQSAIRHLRKTIADFNLRVAAISFQTRHGYHVLENLDRRIEATRQAMQVAFQLGAPVVLNQVGQVPAETDDPQWEVLVQALTDLGRYGQHVGAFLAAGTGSESGPDLKRLIDALPEGSLVVNLDPGNLVINGFFSFRSSTSPGSTCPLCACPGCYS